MATEPASTTDRPARAAAPRARASGRSATASRSTPTSAFKRDDDGLNVRARIENVYAQRGFASIDPSDLRGRMRWWGLYTQRKPGIDGGRTGDARAARARRRVLHAAGPQRRRQPDARAAARDRATSRTTYARDTADITDRQNIQLHWIRIEDVPGDLAAARGRRPHAPPRPAATPRAWCSAPRWPASPPTRSSTARPRSRRSCDRYVGDPRFSNLPRKFKTAISGSPRAGRRARDQRRRRSSASCTPSTARASTCASAAGCRPTRCSPSDSASGCRSRRCPTSGEAVMSVFRDYGYRRLRTRARLKFLVADWGAEKVPRGPRDAST